MSDPDPFYYPSLDLSGQDEWRVYTSYAADLQKAGLAKHFPSDPGLRNLTGELLA